MNTKNTNRGARVWNAMRGTRWVLVGPILLVWVVAGCDFEVVNPGPVSDTFLDNPAAWPGIVGGVQRTMNSAIGGSFSGNIFSSGIRMREVIGTHSYHPLEEFYGTPRSVLTGAPWTTLHAARWAAEDGIRRLQRVLGADAQSNRIYGELHLWAGYANRALGEFYCDAVFDGGPVLPGDTYFTRAEGQFTEAIAVGNAAGAENVARARSGVPCRCQ